MALRRRAYLCVSHLIVAVQRHRECGITLIRERRRSHAEAASLGRPKGISYASR
jgi:hypothetical protein